MAAKSKPAVKKAVDPAIEGDKPENTGDAPASAYPETARDNGAGTGREAIVADEPAKSFDERTGAGTPPWQNEDGTQNTGEETAEEAK